MAEKDIEISSEIKAEIDSEIKAEIAELFRLCPPQQEPSLSLLRGHLLCEYYLERLITLNLPRGDKLTANGDLSFFQKVVLVDSLQIIDDRVMRGLKNLNAVRNQLSHQKDKEITHSDIDRIGQSIGKEFIAARREYGEDMGGSWS